MTVVNAMSANERAEKKREIAKCFARKFHSVLPILRSFFLSLTQSVFYLCSILSRCIEFNSQFQRTEKSQWIEALCNYYHYYYCLDDTYMCCCCVFETRESDMEPFSVTLDAFSEELEK